MDINQAIKASVQSLSNQILNRDPDANIRTTPSAVKAITNNPHVQPLADLHITLSSGKKYLYNIVFFNGGLQSLPVYLGENK